MLEKPIFFSRHNRYTLTSISDLERNSIVVGARMYIGRAYYLLAQYDTSTVKFSNTRRSIDINGEEIAFDDKDYFFEKYNESQELKDSSITFGVGVHF